MAEKAKGDLKSGRGEEVAGSRPPIKGHGNPIMVSGDSHLNGILENIKSSNKHAVVYYGASWCQQCNQTLPCFLKLSNVFKKHLFIYTDIDYCPESTQRIRYTPTFHFYRDGEKVDCMLGTGEERLHDRLWLHS